MVYDQSLQPVVTILRRESHRGVTLTDTRTQTVVLTETYLILASIPFLLSYGTTHSSVSKKYTIFFLYLPMQYLSQQLVTVEEWEYNLGSNGFVRYLRFENGRLIRITEGDYGD